jgi:hypothetical protein
MKTGHGAFVSAGTNHSIVSYDFANVESGRDLYSAYTGKYKLNMQAGYQYNSKPIYLNKAAAARSLKQLQEKKQAEKGYSSYKSRCGMYAGRCGSGNNNASNSTPSTVQDKGWYVSVQPSVGAAYIPSVKNSLNTKTTGSQPVYNFEAGNYSYALVSGVGFELGKNEQRKVTLGINYLKGIGNLNDEVIATGTDAKPTFTRLNSSSSTWSVTAGIPLTLGKKKQVAKQVPPPPPPMQEAITGTRSMRESVVDTGQRNLPSTVFKILKKGWTGYSALTFLHTLRFKHKGVCIVCRRAESFFDSSCT